MRKLASILVLVFAFTLTTQAQKKRKDKRPQLSVEQHTNLAVKKMTLALDLSEKQQNQIKPLLNAQATAKKEAMEKRKEMRKAEKKPTADEMYEMQSKRLDNQIAFKKSMKEILDDEQFEKFEKMAKKRMVKGKKMMKRKRKMKRDREDN
ncbi:Spy/CpxP family protein refolding chaperone [Polaribacter porphyrae]|uniref:DUF4890 domain-containing protein n=1 Tax=Polaribacter porphyrae TaxID=1137780 RepID=A0A2S7WPC4_9FLAO|nr:hypothetical protein [Polaribacter porphyrae]PQJ79433.1 hypothetical protein BTO18_09730 [Polaribacter porphyrae]